MKKRLIIVFVVFAIAGLVWGVVSGSGNEVTEYENMDGLVEILTIVRNYYYKPVSLIDIKNLVTKYFQVGTINGMLEELGDRYTYYMPPEEYEKRWEAITASFGGVGLYLGNEDDDIIIVTPIPDTPAERAGLKSGDRIIAIDGTSTEGMLLTEEAVPMMRGEPGTDVVLTIKRGVGETAEVFDVKLTRAIIEVPSIDWGIIEDDIGYLRIYQFANHTTEEVVRAISDLSSKGIKGIVLDLRYNPGGFLQAAYEIANLFISKGPILHVVDREQERVPFIARPGQTVDYPLVVLVNGGSASAAEILAGALQDTGRARLVGTQTYGKGVVQHIVPLRNGAALSVTIAEYLTAGGRHINGVGLSPDVEIDFPKYTEEELEQMTVEDFVDVQLEKALEVIRSEIASSYDNMLKAG